MLDLTSLQTQALILEDLRHSEGSHVQDVADRLDQPAFRVRAELQQLRNYGLVREVDDQLARFFRRHGTQREADNLARWFITARGWAHIYSGEELVLGPLTIRKETTEIVR